MARKRKKKGSQAPWREAQQSLADSPRDPNALEEVQNQLKGAAESATDAGQEGLAASLTVLADLSEVARCSYAAGNDEASQSADPIVEFVRTALDDIQAVFEDDSEALSRLEATVATARERWGDYLSLLESTGEHGGERGDDGWANAHGDQGLESASADGEAGDSSEQVEMILSALAESESAGGEGGADQSATSEPAGQQQPDAQRQGSAGSDSAGLSPPASVGSPDIDQEVVEAFLDDASRCLASMEQAVLAFENNRQDSGSLAQLCRELHTLKGASATVGLSELAAYLHRVEDYVQAGVEQGCESLSVDPLLECVDAVRKLTAALGDGHRPDQPPAGAPGPAEAAPADEPSSRSASPAPAPQPASAPQYTAPARSDFDDAAPADDESLRVKASRLDRLMDLLAELVMLRNRRETQVTRLQDLQGELFRCVTRLRVVGDSLGMSPSPPVLAEAHAGASPASRLPHAMLAAPYQSTTMTEIAGDISELARSLRDMAEPLHEENMAISRLTRQFRQELMAMRRLPVSGLFRRLQRGARDAARTEGKQVRLELIGEHSGLDRAHQERLYEPLLHLVRNAASHGIEDPEERAAAGKDPVGTITLEAQSGPAALVMEVRDDGRGLDYDAIRRRGLEHGLIFPDQAFDKAELGRLIFHPGFSTRKTVGAISGRGVGMDVVANVIERMRGRIDVESTPGRGTTFRLTVPLRSVIEHTMVVRAGGQLFALPMQFIHAALTAAAQAAAQSGRMNGDGGDGPESGGEGGPALQRLAELLHLDTTNPPPDEQLLVLTSGVGPSASEERPADSRGGSKTRAVRVRLTVDEIIGPEEVVVRSLPPLLRRHPLLSGVTLAGSGEIVLVLDCRRLIESAVHGGGLLEEGVAFHTAPGEADGSSAPRVLIVDDSLSARRTLVRILRRRGFQTAEAGDGREALDRLREERFDAVLSDLEMPRMDGMELVRELRLNDQIGRLPVAIVSSRTEKEIRDRVCELGADAYYIKPVTEQVVDEFFRIVGERATAPE